jgi:beta-RFAP synthase
MTLTLQAPTRLHFGLIHVPATTDPTPERLFGGLGLMLEHPRIQVSYSPSIPTQEVTGTLASRGCLFLRTIQEKLGRPARGHWSFHGPQEHVGLGVGTALGMSIARLLQPQGSLQELARLADRGKRSGIGMWGFAHGGFLYDPGKTSASELPLPARRVTFPRHWRILLIRPDTTTRWHGQNERDAFNRTRSAQQAMALSQSMTHLAESAILPAVEQAHFKEFSVAIQEFNRKAGEPFLAEQQGIYSSQEVTAVIDHCLKLGVVGVGQSSWGPTVFAITESEDQAEYLRRQLEERLPLSTHYLITSAAHTGAVSS